MEKNKSEAFILLSQNSWVPSNNEESWFCWCCPLSSKTSQIWKMITAEESQHHTDNKPMSNLKSKGGKLLVFFGGISLFYVILIQHL